MEYFKLQKYLNFEQFPSSTVKRVQIATIGGDSKWVYKEAQPGLSCVVPSLFGLIIDNF